MPGAWLVKTKHWSSVLYVMSPTKTIYHLRATRDQYDPTAKKLWIGKSCRYPHTKGNFSWQFVDGFLFFLCIIAQHHKGKRQIKDHTPDYSCIPMIFLKSLCLALQLREAGHKNNTPVALPPWDAVQRRKFKALQTPGSLRSTHWCQHPLRGRTMKLADSHRSSHECLQFISMHMWYNWN